MHFKQIQLTPEERESHDGVMRAKQLGLRADAELVRGIEKVDRMKTYEKFGQASIFAYCQNVVGLTASGCSAVKTVARKSREVPELVQMMGAKHSLWTMAKLAPHITEKNKSEWLEKLRTLPVKELEVEIAKVSTRKKSDKIEKGESHANLTAELDHETAELLKRAQAIVSQSQKKPASFNETLKQALETFLEKNDPVRKAQRNFSREKLTTTHGPLTAAQKNAVHKRDRQKCQAILPSGEKCESMHFTDIHHIVRRELGGTNALENLTTLCSGHHRIVHRGDWKPPQIRH